ncbi:hypothetical protein GCM10009765_60350 [Fodinicola feengrottensis]|uniref:Uncharacterized protein n=1 Tax=Fodinicola feengrottensis TaxID=435914 RepID=A0ABN2IDA0_9ACTN
MAARRSQFAFETRNDLPVSADRHQVHTVESAAVADGQGLLARRVHSSFHLPLTAMSGRAVGA